MSPRAVLLDANGTLLQLEPPVPLLAAALAAEGFPVRPDDVAAALRAEIAHYRTHMLTGRDTAGLAELRRGCAEVFARSLPHAPPPARTTEILVASLRFAPFPEVPGVLAELRSRGVRTAVVSNWDCALPGHLDRIGLGPLLDAVVTSAAEGAAKPDPRIFRAALTRLGAVPGDALHVGDDPDADLAGARAAGVRGVLLDREGRHPGIPGRIPDLTGLLELAAP